MAMLGVSFWRFIVLFDVQPVWRAFLRLFWAPMIQLHALGPILDQIYWAGQLKEGKGCRQTLDCYCVSCELLSASIADALLFVNILVSGIFHGRFAQQLAVNKPYDL